MGLALKQVYEKLKEKFPAGVLSIAEPPGDAFCVLSKDVLVDACRWLKTDPEMGFDLCISVAGVDDTKTFWSVYHLASTSRNHKAVLKVDAGREEPSVPSLVSVWKAADWHERETYDMYGIRYEGHPDLRRILLPEDWPGYPLRKDYEFPDEYQGIPLK
jgi:NADH-quinone oxidoreductase subunit C